MMGSLGVGGNLNKWTEQEFAEATSAIAYYKKIRKTVQEGRLYRLASPREGNLAASQYNAEDGKQSVVFAFLQAQQFGRPAPALYLRGLEEGALYRITPFDDKLSGGRQTASGAWLMNHGLRFRLAGNFDSTSVLLERID